MSFFKAPKKIIQEIITFLYRNLQEHVMLGAKSRKNEKKTYIWWKDLQLVGLNVEGDMGCFARNVHYRIGLGLMLSFG